MLQADSEQECQLWITAIQAGVSQAYRDSPHKDEVNILPLYIFLAFTEMLEFLEDVFLFIQDIFCQEFCC